jgi:hypothetical protein
LVWGSLGAFVIAAFAVAVFLSAGSDSGGRPYVGGDFHALAVDPANPRKVLVGGHGGGAVSEDGGRT